MPKIWNASKIWHAPKIWPFWVWRAGTNKPVQYGRESAQKQGTGSSFLTWSLHIHESTENETINGAWEKSAAADSAEPNIKAILQRLRLLFLLRQQWQASSFFQGPKFSEGANIFPCAKVLASAKFFGCANVFVSAKVFGCANVFVSAKDFGCANVFVYICWRLFFCVFFSAFLLSMRQ